MIEEIYKRYSSNKLSFLIFKENKTESTEINIKGINYKLELGPQIDVIELLFYSQEQKDYGVYPNINKEPTLSTIYYLAVSNTKVDELLALDFKENFKKCEYSSIAKLFLMMGDIKDGLHTNIEYPIIKEIFLAEA